tara:strand:+ start:4926 stop:5093 length:168 start_codon:yes stop_codon:yes gene_type:complete
MSIGFGWIIKKSNSITAAQQIGITSNTAPQTLLYKPCQWAPGYPNQNIPGSPILL